MKSTHIVVAMMAINLLILTGYGFTYAGDGSGGGHHGGDGNRDGSSGGSPPDPNITGQQTDFAPGTTNTNINPAPPPHHHGERNQSVSGDGAAPPQVGNHNQSVSGGTPTVPSTNAPPQTTH